MISRRETERLAAISSEKGILSAYVGMDRGRDRRQLAAGFKGAVKAAERRLKDDRWHSALKRESNKVLSFLEVWEPRGRGLAIFSSEPEGIWEALSLQVSVPNYADLDTTTKTGILMQILDEFPYFAVAIVQRDKARIFLSEQRASDVAGEVSSDVHGQHSRGGWSQARWQRHIEVQVLEHFKEVIAKLTELDRDRPFKGLAIGGTEETVKELQKRLPERLSSKVIGTFPVDFKHQTEEAILEHARGLRYAQERSEEEDLVEQAIKGAKSDGQGEIGIKNTLGAVLEGRVRTLIVASGSKYEGSICQSCEHLSVENPEVCPVCGGRMNRGDMADRVLEQAFLKGARVNVVYEAARDRLVEHGGGIGAILRF